MLQADVPNVPALTVGGLAAHERHSGALAHDREGQSWTDFRLFKPESARKNIFSTLEHVETQGNPA